MQHPKIFIFVFLSACITCVSTAPAESLPVRAVFLTLLEEIEVPAREAGVLSQVEVHEGQRIARGDVIGRLDDEQARLARERAAIELRKAQRDAENELEVQLAEKHLELTLLEWKRAQNSHARVPRSVSQSELDELRLATERARTELERAEYQRGTAELVLSIRENELLTAEDLLARRRIVAPIDGVVVEIERQGGEWVEPGQPVLRLVRIDRLRAEGLLDAKDVQDGLLGASVRLQVKLRDETAEFPGVVNFVSPEVEPVSGQVRIWAEIANRELRLRPGMSASMWIERELPR